MSQFSLRVLTDVWTTDGNAHNQANDQRNQEHNNKKSQGDFYHFYLLLMRRILIPGVKLSRHDSWGTGWQHHGRLRLVRFGQRRLQMKAEESTLKSL